MKKLSIIVPVYNCQSYLSKCLDSLINQSLKDIEIICVNDGSVDNSMDVLNYYKNKCKDKIKIINKKNEGALLARMDGIKASNSEYICFVDADDYVKKDFALKLYKNIKSNNSDIAICGYDRVDINTNKVYCREMCKSSKYNFIISENPGYLLEINTSLWNKIYKSEILKSISIMKSVPKVLEDMMMLELIYSKSNKITFLNESLLYYRVRNDSLINNINSSDLNKIYKSIVETRNIINKTNPYLLDYVSVNAFLHLGVSLMYRISYNKNINFKDAFKYNYNFLKSEFPSFLNSEYISVRYVIKNKRNQKLFFMKIIYKLHLFRLFIFTYKFITKIFKFDIKW